MSSQASSAGQPEDYDRETLNQWDRKHLIHPATNYAEQAQKDPLIIDRGEGCTVWDPSGKEYLDGVAGLWLLNVGYGREEIVEAVRDQMSRLPFFPIFFGYSTPPAIHLARKLAMEAPGDLNHVLFATGGSEANEAAIRLARFYFHIKGEPAKRKIIARRRAYHGVTHAAGSATGIESIRGPASAMDPGIVHIESPRDVEDAEALEEKILEEGPETVAAFIAEPIPGVGGIHVPPVPYYQQVRDICDQYDVLFLCDEVITGFGRIGHMFGIQEWGVEPDMMSLAKGLSSGYQPIGATLISDPIFDVLGQIEGTLSHGHTYAGHPAACRAALANIEILEREDLPTAAVDRGKQLRREIRDANHPGIEGVRGRGLMNAIALREPVAQAVFEECLREGVILRALDDHSLSTSPPLVITEQEISRLVSTVTTVLDRVGNP